jgi:hypothetical protein
VQSQEKNIVMNKKSGALIRENACFDTNNSPHTAFNTRVHGFSEGMNVPMETA